MGLSTPYLQILLTDLPDLQQKPTDLGFQPPICEGNTFVVLSCLVYGSLWQFQEINTPSNQVPIIILILLMRKQMISKHTYAGQTHKARKSEESGFKPQTSGSFPLYSLVLLVCSPHWRKPGRTKRVAWWAACSRGTDLSLEALRLETLSFKSL